MCVVGRVDLYLGCMADLFGSDSRWGAPVTLRRCMVIMVAVYTASVGVGVLLGGCLTPVPTKAVVGCPITFEGVHRDTTVVVPISCADLERIIIGK